MYAIVNADGHQRRLGPGEIVWIEKQSAQPGDRISLNEVLLLNDGQSVTVGTPTVDGASV